MTKGRRKARYSDNRHQPLWRRALRAMIRADRFGR